MRIFLTVLFIISLGSCVKRPFVPVNVGREHGNPTTPWVVSHVPEKNRWALSRTDHHNFLQKIVCFDYVCRKMIGRRKALMAISFKKFQKQIRKNAKKGLYKKYTPTVKLKSDTIPQQADTVQIFKAPQPTAAKPITPLGEPILKADSLITLSELLFETNSHELKAEHFPALDSIGQFLKTYPTLEVIVSGHTDNTGNERHNIALSARRAETVAEYLIDKGAVYDQVTFEGFGSSRPISGNDSAASRSKNRRVEILIRNPIKK